MKMPEFKNPFKKTDDEVQEEKPSMGERVVNKVAKSMAKRALDFAKWLISLPMVRMMLGVGIVVGIVAEMWIPLMGFDMGFKIGALIGAYTAVTK